MPTLTVNTATPADRARLLSTLSLAFARDPINRWVWPEPHEYITHFPALADALGGNGIAHRAAHYVEGFTAANLWLPPDVASDEARIIGLIESSTSASRRPTLYRILEQMAAYRPQERHWYFALLGVDPVAQGRGYGSALLQHGLAQVDREGAVAYAEASNPAVIPLCERLGFTVIGTIQVDDAPPLVPMIRTAR